MRAATKRDAGSRSREPRAGDSVVMSVVRLIAELVGAGMIAVTLYVILDSASTTLGRSLRWDPSLTSGVLFLMLGGTTLVLCMPLLHTDSDANTRSFSSWTAILLVSFAVLRGLGIVSLAAPLGFLEHQIMTPLRHLLNL